MQSSFEYSLQFPYMQLQYFLILIMQKKKIIFEFEL